jgi:ankyrin repeat protein
VRFKFKNYRNTALQLACMKQRFHVIDALLQNKANPNDVNMSGWNCLISAVNYFHEDSAIMLLLLLQVISLCDWLIYAIFIFND